ncbi:TPA: glycoside hydrolase family 3 protein [Burkholderia cenocepacia]|nr:glycoside hydrolase family 3 protein [Burkholderia sp. BCC0506]HEF5873637.1 glycoside hydrolase family 3 protein [Burkholderia cenocepacia]
MSGTDTQDVSERHASDADARARATEARMTDDERYGLLYSLMVRVFGRGERESRVPHDLPVIAGYVQGVPRLGVPALKLADASLGIRDTETGDAEATAFPAGLALGSTFDPELARRVGHAIGREARSREFNVALGGGINLIRDVRNGRNFEYVSEDPLLSGMVGGAVVAGMQAEGVVAVLKHLSLNATETNKFFLNAIIDPDAHRESDLLAFQIAIEQGRPGALMGAYNLVNGAYACGNGHLLNDVVKGAMGFRGWIMSDWRAVHGWEYALHGLDQHSGAQLDEQEWFNEPLRRAVEANQVPKERIRDMVVRILRSCYEAGIDRQDTPPEVDHAAHHALALQVARQGAVLLRNRDGLLPLAPTVRRIVLIGGYGQAGVLSGSGSSQVKPRGGYGAVIPQRTHALLGPTAMHLYGESLVSALRTQFPGATIEYDSGAFVAEAARRAGAADIAIVNAIRHEGERFDCPDMSLPYGQDALIDAVAAANRNTVVVLQTGNPVAMPWRDRVAAILQAWYPGQAGAQAIAEILAGTVNPSGRLPVTFPVDVEQTPHPVLPCADVELGTFVDVHYREGAEVGYRWFAKRGTTPLFGFGFGLGYSTFSYGGLVVDAGESISARFTVTNTGERDGDDIPQLYLTGVDDGVRMRLLGFRRVALAAGESTDVTIEIDPRLLAHFDGAAGNWHLRRGRYRLVLARAATLPVIEVDVELAERRFGA